MERDIQLIGNPEWQNVTPLGNLVKNFLLFMTLSPMNELGSIRRGGKTKPVFT
jgi:hypothetical protein